MAENFVDYAKDVWNSLTNSKENKQTKDEVIKALEKYLREQVEADGVPDKPTLPDAPKYDKIDYDAPSDEEIASSAKQGLDEFKNSSVSGIEDEVRRAREGYEKDKLSKESALKDKNAVVEKAYAAAKEDTNDDMLKRGIARSSIAANKSAELDGEKAAVVTKTYNDYKDEITRLNSEIDGLEGKREKALNDFNISYASRLTKSINELKSDREKNATEALKYNNTITEKQHRDEVNKIKDESNLYSDALSQKEKENSINENDEGKSRYLKNYNVMAENLRKMNKSDARQLLEDNKMFAANLDDYHYYLLYNEFCR